MRYKRGSVHYIDFGPYRGSEQGGIRPGVILSNDVGNLNGPVLIVAPITTKLKNKIPTHVELDDYDFLKGKNIILMEQITTKDKKSVKEKLGTLNDTDLFKLEYYASISLQLYESNSEFEEIINLKIESLRDLKGYINIHINKFNEINSIKDDINQYNESFNQFKTFCKQHSLNYKYLYDETINILG